jgi:hypothetical protein
VKHPIKDLDDKISGWIHRCDEVRFKRILMFELLWREYQSQANKMDA